MHPENLYVTAQDINSINIHIDDITSADHSKLFFLTGTITVLFFHQSPAILVIPTRYSKKSDHTAYQHPDRHVGCHYRAGTPVDE